MIVVKVEYTVLPEFEEENRNNIASFLQEMSILDNTEFQYTVLASADGLTFTHLSMYKNEQIQQQLLQLKRFLFFQLPRDTVGLNANPVIEQLELVGGTSNFFALV